MQFDNIQEYIDQVYGVELSTSFLNDNVHSLMYLKLVRLLSKLGIETSGMTAEALFAEAARVERGAYDHEVTKLARIQLMFQLADIHADIEMLIHKAGKAQAPSKGFDNKEWANDINS